MAAKIEERFQVGMYKARRVIRTESNYCINQSELKGMKDAGFDEYEFISLGENAENVCDTCDDLDGQRFRIADAVVGVNCPPMHPFCRCKVTTSQETLEDIRESSKHGCVRGIDQIKHNPGGVMLDYNTNHVNLSTLELILDRRMKWYHDITADIMVVSNNEVVKVYRYKK